MLEAYSKESSYLKSTAPVRGAGIDALKSCSTDELMPLKTSSFSTARPCYHFRTKIFYCTQLQMAFAKNNNNIKMYQNQNPKNGNTNLSNQIKKPIRWGFNIQRCHCCSSDGTCSLK